MPDFVERVNWEQYRAFLLEGEPSIALQLAVVNAALFGFWLLCRVRAGKPGKGNARLLPVIVAVCNVAVLSFGDRLAI